MFDFKDKNLLESLDNGIKITNSIESGKNIFIENSRTGCKYKIIFTKINGSSYKVTLQCENEELNKETKLLMNGKIALLLFDSIVSLFIKDDKLHIIAAEELNLYE